MKYDIKETNIDLTDSIKSFLDKRMKKLNKFTKNANTYAQVDIGMTTKGQQSGNIYRTEINLNIDGQYFRAESKKDNLYNSIDDAQADILRSLKSERKKKERLYKKGARKFKSIVKGIYGR